MAKKKKKKVMYRVKTKEKVADIEKKKDITKEEKFYWVRLAVGVISALLGVLVFKLVGWWMFLYMMLLLLGWPFIQSFLIFRLPYKKDKWDWKQILKTGIGGYFFTFMFVSTICFTLVSYPAWDDRLSNPADTYDIQIEGNIAYIADGNNGFMILDISSPNHRVLLGKVDDIDVQNIFIHENHAYLGDSNNQLLIFDIRDETNPIMVSSYNFTTGKINSIFVEENIAYVALGETGLSILNVEDSPNPSVMGSITNGTFNDVIVENGTAYLADMNYGLVMANVSNPAKPIIVSSLILEGQIMALDLVESNIFIAAGERGLYIANLSTIENPQLLGSYNTTANASRVIIDEDMAYVSNGELGISFVDILDLSNPINKTDDKLYNTIGFANNFAIYNDHLFIADGDKGLTTINLTNPPIEPEEIAASASKTIPFGWTWGVVSILTIASIVTIIKKNDK